MKHFLIYFFCLATFFSSCTPKDKVPKALIQPEKMGDVIWDVMRMQFLAEENTASDSLLKQEDELKKLTEKVFIFHRITAKNFQNSYNWYVEHPTLLKRIFDSMQVQKQRNHNDNEDGIEELEDVPVLVPPNEAKLERNNKRTMRTVE